MSTDSQGRPLSDDGQWAWSGTEWVPAAGGPAGFEPTAGSAAAQAAEPDVGATIIAPSPFAGGVVAPPAGAAGSPGSVGQQPPYGGTPQPPQGGTPSFQTPSPGYGGAAAYGTPTAQKSRKPLVLGLIGVLVVAALVVAAVFVFGGSGKKGPSGAFTCTVPGSAETGKITFAGSDAYSLSGTGKPGTYTRKAGTLTFTSGSLNKSTAAFDSGAKTLKILIEGQTLSCRQ